VERLLSDTDEVLSQRLRIGRAQDTTRLERLFFAELERSLRRTDDGTRNSAFAGSLNFHGGWRDLDSIVLPSDGETLSIQLGIGRSRGTDADTGNFGRAYGRLTVYRPLGRTWYGQARVELGRVFLGEHGGARIAEVARRRRRLGARLRLPHPGAAGRRQRGQRHVAGHGQPGTGAPGVGADAFGLGRRVHRRRQRSRFVRPAQARAGLRRGRALAQPGGPAAAGLARAQKTGKARLHFSVGIAF
jgi:translocation and assembly module TamA